MYLYYSLKRDKNTKIVVNFLISPAYNTLR
nr:MAG TPA: hypothetical protein [Caudoviricetes sp.]